jgi:hypothetical protein
MGWGLYSQRLSPFRLRDHVFCGISLCAVVGIGLYGPPVFGVCVMEYQWGFTQPHP